MAKFSLITFLPLLIIPVFSLADDRSHSFLPNASSMSFYESKNVAYGDDMTLYDNNVKAFSEQADGAGNNIPPTYSFDYAGLKRDTYYFFGFQFSIIGVLYVAPESVSGWSEEQKQNFTIEKYKHNVQDIIWDNDKFYINYLLHPYWGMGYYIRARERGVDNTNAFWYSVALSSMWEFGIEAMFEEASIQDIFITPIVGSVIGKYVDKYRSKLRMKPVLTGMDEWMLGFTDPLGATNRWVDGLFGKKASVSFKYSAINPVFMNTRHPEYPGVGREIYVQRIIEPSIGLTFDYKL